MAGQGYEVFVSYSRAASTQLAIALQADLERFAKPWNRLRAMRVFRDDSSMSANTGLWSAIERGLNESKWFVLLATPEAASSEYVNNEVAWWVSHKGPARILLVQAGGTIAWDRSRGDFDAATDSIPPSLRGAYSEEPRWVDLRWYSAEDGLGKSDPRFAERVADLSSAIQGIERDTLIGENVRQHNKARRFTRAAIAGLSALLVAALGATGVAVTQNLEATRQREAAEEQALVATTRQLAAEAQNAAETDLQRALLLAETAYQTRNEPQTVRALHAVVSKTPQLVGFYDFGEQVTVVDGTADASVLVAGTESGKVYRWDRMTGERTEVMAFPYGISVVAISDDGQTIAANAKSVNENGVPVEFDSAIWRNGEVTDVDGNFVALSPSGRTAALLKAVEVADSVLGDYVVEVVVDGQRTQVTNTGPVTSWVELPDDATVVAMSEYGVFTRAALDGSQREETTIPMGTWMFGGRISQDGKRFTYTNGGSEIEVWDLEGPLDDQYDHGTLSGLTGNASVTDITLSPDGTRMATSARGSIFVSDVAPIGSHTTGITELAGAGGDPHSLRFLNDSVVLSASGSSAALWDLSREAPLAHEIKTAVSSTWCSACGPEPVSVSPDGSKAVIMPALVGTTIADFDSGRVARAEYDLPATAMPQGSFDDSADALWLDETRVFGWGQGIGWVLGGEDLTTVERSFAVPPADRAVLRADGAVAMLGEGLLHLVDPESGESLSGLVFAETVTSDGAYALRLVPSEDGGDSTGVDVIDTTTLDAVLTTRVQGQFYAFAEQPEDGVIALMRVVDEGADTELMHLHLADGRVSAVGRLGLAEEVLLLSMASSSTMVAIEEPGEVGLYSLLDASRLSLIPVVSGVRAWNSLGFNRDGSILLVASEPASTVMRVPVMSAAWSRIACGVAGRPITREELESVVGSTSGLTLGCTGAASTRTDVRVPGATSEPNVSHDQSGDQPSSDAVSVGDAGVWDVGAFDMASFSSPSGNIWCGMINGSAACEFSMSMSPNLRPDPDIACPGVVDYGPVGVSVDTQVRWVCSGGALVWPVAGQSETEWATQFDTIIASPEGMPPDLVTLPYGASLRHGDITCTSRDNGVTCRNDQAEQGFTVSYRGVTTLDGTKPLPSN